MYAISNYRTKFIKCAICKEIRNRNGKDVETSYICLLRDIYGDKNKTLYVICNIYELTLTDL